MATQNLKRKKNNNLKDQKRTRPSKVSTIIRPLSAKQMGKPAEEALQEIAERFRLAFENANIGMCLVDLQGRLTKVNRQMCEIFGYSQEEFEGMNVNDIAHSEDLDISPTFIKRATSGEIEQTNFEKRYFHKDGHVVCGQVSSSLVRDAQGKPQYFISHVQDITQRKKAEEALRSERDKFRGMLLSINDGVDIVNKDYIIEFQNELLLERFGDKTGEKCYAAYMGLEEPCHFCSIQEAIKTGSATRVELVGKDGRNYELNSSPFIDVDGEVKVIELVRDITERKRTEETLRESETKYRELTDLLPETIFECDDNGKLLFTNRYGFELFGYTQEDFNKGLNIFQMIIPEDRGKAKQNTQRLFRGEKLFGTEYTALRKDGSTFPAIMSSNLIFCEHRPAGLRGIVIDITERKRAEASLRESEERYRTILENIEDGYYEVDLPGNFTFFNDSLCQILGYSKEEMIGMGNQQYTDQENRKKLFQAFNKVYNTEEPVKGFDWKVFRKDGTKLFGEVSVSLIKDSKGQSIGFRGIARDITERKQAEEVLRKSEEEFRLTFENAKDAIVWADPEAGVITKCNKEAETLFEKKREEIIGSQQTTLHPPQKAEYYTNMFKRHIEHKGVADDEAEVITKSGKIKPVNITASLTLVGGKPIIQGIFRDITERKQAEEALRNEKQRFQTLSDQAPFGMVMVDRNGTFKYINPKFRELFGYDLTDIPDGKTWFRKAYPNPTYRHNVISAWIDDLKNIKQEEKRSRTFTVTCKDGTEKAINFIPVQLETGENLMACDDITKRIQTEEALRESEGRYRTLFEGSKDAVYITNREGKFISVNPAFLELFGYTKEELNLLSAQDTYVNPLDRNRFRQEIEQKGFVRDYEVKLRNKDGTEIDCLLTSSMRRDNDRSILGYQGIIRDITARKRSEQEMAALQEQFRQSQKMEAVGRLGGGIAHDFNNLLTIIKGYSQLSLLDLKENDPLWGNIQEIQKATQRATDLTRQLLAFSRRQILDLKVLDLNTLLKDLDKMLRRIIGEDIELTTLLAENLGRVKIDPGQFEQIILNLAVNARDAMPSGGKLTIETANVVLDGEYARTHVSVTPGPYVRLSVSDTGGGIPLEVKEKVFEPFFTTKEKGKGTGLGLSTVYGIVKQSGGNIWVYSEPAHGTTFKIYLPRVEEDLDTLHGRDETDFLPRGSETVLLVEDEPSVRDLALRLLNQQGYKVLEAANGEEALRVVQEHIGEKIHLLLTDVVMPQMGGKELANQLKLLRPDVKVLYTSGYTDDAIVHHGVLEPGTHFLQKPFSPKTLTHKMREVLDR
jgi:PAS domain S-box-containing protein